jgi:hypothetical protein
MSMTTYPLALPKELLAEIKRTADDTKLSLADAMRQAIRLGLPRVRRNLSTEEDFSEAAADTWEKLGPAPTVLYDKL